MKVEFKMETVSCGICGAAIVASPDFFHNRREDHAIFYCLSGHKNYYPGKSEAEKLQEQLALETKKNRELQLQLDKSV